MHGTFFMVEVNLSVIFASRAGLASYGVDFFWASIRSNLAKLYRSLMAIAPESHPRSANNDRLRWRRGVQNEFTRTNLDDLAAGAIPAIYLTSFLDGPAVYAFREFFGRCAREFYKEVVPQIVKYGPSVFEHVFTARQHYFTQARVAENLVSSIWNNISSPLDHLRDCLVEDCGLVACHASDAAFGPYFAGTLRSIEEGTPVHIDFAPHESPGWEMISSVSAQLAANVYLEAPANPGNLVIYEKLWTLEDEWHRLDNRFGYDDAVVYGVPFEIITPVEGALVLFNSRFFHRVEATRSSRLTYSFFLGFHTGKIIFWS